MLDLDSGSKEAPAKMKNVKWMLDCEWKSFSEKNPSNTIINDRTLDVNQKNQISKVDYLNTKKKRFLKFTGFCQTHPR